MIGQNAITGWRSKIPWRNDLQVEQDLILHAMIQAKVHRDLLIQNLDDKMKDQSFLDDVTSLLIHGADYDPLKAADFVNREIFSLVSESKSKSKKKQGCSPNLQKSCVAKSHA